MVIDRVKSVVHLNNLLDNYNLLRKIYGGKEIYAVVKADAYGHGAIECSRFLEKNNCKHFAVTALKEAIELRNNGITSEILIFGYTDCLNVRLIDEYNLVQTVHSFDYANKLNSYGKKININLNIDTGMSRFGIYLHDELDILNVKEEIKKIAALDNICIKGIYTHFTSSESDRDFTLFQKKLFDKLLISLEENKISYGKTHIANSSAIIGLHDLNYDLARSGIALYGYPPIKSKERFKPVLELYARVIQLKDLKAKDTVSYGRTFLVEKDMRIATVAIGYADGYSRHFSNNDYFVYKGYKLRVLGRVCMGLTMIEVTSVPIEEGDWVEVFGLNKPLEDMAERIGTITYELLTNLAKPRMNRVY
jgi:alanine racemase